ncbi:hypothetical protein [Dermacoccus nishinomiyaensis]|nr:hypothetical protein [Dermacoccus nishinomiyaensis]
MTDDLEEEAMTLIQAVRVGRGRELRRRRAARAASSPAPGEDSE